MSAKKKKNALLLPLAALALAAAAGAAYFGLGKSGLEPAAKPGAAVAAQRIGQGESLVIPIKDLSVQAKFFPVEVDGTKMEVLAVKDSAGKVRTAFNTCQVCYGSGRGVYTQQGNELVCGNCGNHFGIDQVEVEAGGCNPFPIFPENKTETADSIAIGYDFLKEAKVLFARWKKTI
ncbi:MAG: DUF2318 domain-containing protein [Pyramidobacter sp.]|nr:DUF2318 domain-containing protein [Pyramidobacter sp.]